MKMVSCICMRCFLTAAAMLASANSTQVRAQTKDADPVSVVRQAVRAMGGVAALENLKTITVRGRAQHWAPGESFETGGKPRFLGNAAFVISRDFAAGKSRTEWNRSFKFPFSHPQGFIEIVTDRAGFVQGIDATNSYRTMTDLKSSPPEHAMSGVRLATEQRELARRSPRFLLEALQHPDRLQRLPGQTVAGRTLPAIGYKNRGSEFTWMFDPATHLPARIRVRDEDPLQGDSDFDLVFSDWRGKGALMLPFHMEYQLNGAAIAQIHYLDVRINPELPAHLFAIPEAITIHAPVPATEHVPYQWVIRRQYLGLYLDTDAVNYDPARGGLHLVSLAPGIDQVRGGTHNSLIVAMDDYLIVFDAPINAWQSRWTLAAAARKYPHKPVKYLVLSHHHTDHSGGARTYVAHGASVVVARGDKAFFEKVFAAPHTIEPDQLQRHPRQAEILEVDGRRVLGDGHRKLVLYTVANSHVKNMLIGYVPDAGICFVVDLWSPLRDTAPTGGQKALYKAIQKRGIHPKLCAGGHGYAAPYDDLQRLMDEPAPKAD